MTPMTEHEQIEEMLKCNRQMVGKTITSIDLVGPYVRVTVDDGSYFEYHLCLRSVPPEQLAEF